MERKCDRMTEGQVCMFALPAGMSKPAIVDAIETALDASGHGRVIGSGVSLIGDGTVTVDVCAYHVDEASDCIAETCDRLRCNDYEMTWD